MCRTAFHSRGSACGATRTRHREGTTVLSIPDDGLGGVGSQIGVLDVKLRSYRAKWNVSNAVMNAEVDTLGQLRLHVEVRARTLIAGSEAGSLTAGAGLELPSPRWGGAGT
ncbi:MAG: hypothetical protein U0132_02140 [Gemmatimonadaceae bacterium]